MQLKTQIISKKSIKMKFTPNKLYFKAYKSLLTVIFFD